MFRVLVTSRHLKAGKETYCLRAASPAAAENRATGLLRSLLRSAGYHGPLDCQCVVSPA